jgi:LysR family transcriptional regulator, hydrogen peroxide-inducible genes activator
VGVVQSLGSYLLPHLIPDLHDGFPDLRLYVREGLADTLIQRLEDGAIDFLFYPLPVARADLVTVPLFREPLLVVLPREHRLARAPEIRRTDLKGETILTLEPGHRLYEQVRALAEDYEAVLSHDFEGTSLDTLRQMVAMGLGITLLPALYVRSEVARENLVLARPMSGEQPAREIGMVWRRGSARDAEFRDLAQIVAGILTGRVPEVTVLDWIEEAPAPAREGVPERAQKPRTDARRPRDLTSLHLRPGRPDRSCCIDRSEALPEPCPGHDA